MVEHQDTGSWDVVVTPWHVDEPISAFPVPNAAIEVHPSPSPLPAGPPTARMNRLHRAAADVVAQTNRPLVLSGDCPTARAVVAPLQRRHPDLAVVWIDAHGDFNTPAISTSGYIGGMAMSMLTGRIPGMFDDTLGLEPIPETDVVLADGRDLDTAERAALDDSCVRRVPVTASAVTAAVADLAGRPVYLHLDIDVITSAELRGARFPSGTGPTFAQIEECLTAVCATAEVVAVYIACAWLPDCIGDRRTREAITRLAGALGATLVWP